MSTDRGMAMNGVHNAITKHGTYINLGLALTLVAGAVYIDRSIRDQFNELDEKITNLRVEVAGYQQAMDWITSRTSNLIVEFNKHDKLGAHREAEARLRDYARRLSNLEQQ